MDHQLTIDPEFQQLLPPLSTEAYAQLEANLLKDGCMHPIVTWNGFIVDGHNRYALCRHHNIAFETKEMAFADRDAVMDWIDVFQIGKRNLTPAQYKLALGRRYNRTKKAVGGQVPGSRVVQNEPPISTAATLAAEHGVSESTVKRAGKFAEQVEANRELQQTIREGKPAKTPRAERPKYPKEEKVLSEAAIKAGEDAEKDSETLWLLKSTWKKATKRDKSLFMAWATTTTN
jgi:hypothetical protein